MFPLCPDILLTYPYNYNVLHHSPSNDPLMCQTKWVSDSMAELVSLGCLVIALCSSECWFNWSIHPICCCWCKIEEEPIKLSLFSLSKSYFLDCIKAKWSLLQLLSALFVLLVMLSWVLTILRVQFTRIQKKQQKIINMSQTITSMQLYLV